MEMILLSDSEKDATSGVYKKTVSQAIAMNKKFETCYLFSIDYGKLDIDTIQNGIIVNSETITFEKNSKKYTKEKSIYVIRFIETRNIKMIYIRKQMVHIQLLLFLKNFSRKSTLIMEIPTFPFYKELMSSIKKEKTSCIKKVLKMIYVPLREYFISYLLYNYSAITTIVLSNSKTRIRKKMIPIYNGVADDINKIHRKDEKGIIHIISVAWFHDYHGVDRLILALARYYQLGGKANIVYDIVGGGEVQSLQELVEYTNMSEHVIFHGIRTKEALAKLYESTDISACCLGSFRRNADIDTTIKLSESIAYGIPVMTSGQVTQFTNKNMIFQVSNDENDIDIHDLLVFIKNVRDNNYSYTNEEIKSVRWTFIIDSLVLNDVLLRKLDA